MDLSQKRVECPFYVGDEILPQVKEFSHLGVLLMTEERMECEIDRQLVQKLKLLIYRSIHFPALTAFGHNP